MSLQKAKQKSALIVVATLFAFFAVPTLLVLLHDFILAIVAITSFITCVGLLVWGTWEIVFEEIHARDKMIEDLYARCNSEKQRWYTSFYIDYFGL